MTHAGPATPPPHPHMYADNLIALNLLTSAVFSVTHLPVMKTGAASSGKVVYAMRVFCQFLGSQGPIWHVLLVQRLVTVQSVHLHTPATYVTHTYCCTESLVTTCRHLRSSIVSLIYAQQCYGCAMIIHHLSCYVAYHPNCLTVGNHLSFRSVLENL